MENSLVSNRCSFSSGVVTRNGLIAAQLQAGAESFNVPFWADLSDAEADITSDDPTVLSTPLKIGAAKQVVRKSFLHQSWSEMSLASELSGSDALARIQSRVNAYWDRQLEKRLIASLRGVLASNITNNAGDMVNDISGASGAAADFSAEAVIDTASTLGDRLEDCKAIAMHSDIYTEALKNELIEFVPQSQGLTAEDVPWACRHSGRQPDSRIWYLHHDPVWAGEQSAMQSRSRAPGTVRSYSAPGSGQRRRAVYASQAASTSPFIRSALRGLTAQVAGAVVGDSPTQAELAAGAHWTRVVSPAQVCAAGLPHFQIDIPV